MENTSQPQLPPLCQCEQQFGDALPLLIIALVAVIALNRWSSWRKKKQEKASSNNGAKSGGEK